MAWPDPLRSDDGSPIKSPQQWREVRRAQLVADFERWVYGPFPGSPRGMDVQGLSQSREVLSGAAPDGGLWTCRKVATWMAERLGRPVGEVRGWEAMRALGFSPQRPRPRATLADADAQIAFKKGGSKPVLIPSAPTTPRPS
jgi:transposase